MKGNKYQLHRVGAVFLAVAMGTLMTFPSIAGASAISHKKLSVTQVSIASSSTADFGLTYITQQAGIFKKNGLNVTLDAESGGTSAGNVAAFLGGAWTFFEGAASNFLAARQAGAPIDGLMSIDEGENQEMTISATAAAQFHIPGDDSTLTQQIAQVEALKGTHITLALSTTASPGAIYSEAVFNKYGITWGVNCTTCDVNEQTAGTSAAQIAAFNAGKDQAFVTTSPQSIAGTNSTYINIGNIPPVAQMSGIYLSALDSFVEQHPDTVQAVINSLVQGWAYAKQHPTAAERMYSQYQITYDALTSPDTIEALYVYQSAHWITPLMTRASFNVTVHVFNETQTPLVTVPFSEWVQPKFVYKAIKTLPAGIKVPANWT